VFFAEPGADWNRMGAAAANLSLFASKRMLEIRIPTGKPGTEGSKAWWPVSSVTVSEAPADQTAATSPS
jgi:hypothetical protein